VRTAARLVTSKQYGCDISQALESKAEIMIAATSSRHDMVAAMPKLRAFATPQSCFISIKVVAVGQQTRTNVDCINTEFAGFLVLVGFAWRKK
jgi:hypothetical protein